MRYRRFKISVRDLRVLPKASRKFITDIFRANLAAEENNAKVPTSATTAPLSAEESVATDVAKDPSQIGPAGMRTDSHSVLQNCHPEYEKDIEAVARSSNCLRGGNYTCQHCIENEAFLN